MGLFIKQPATNPLPELTAEVAQEIYDKILLTNGDNLSMIFTKYGYRIGWVKQVFIEAKRLEREAIAYCQDNEVVTKAAIIAAITSDLLDTTYVGRDIIKYNPTYDEDRTFAEFRAAYPYQPTPVSSVTVAPETMTLDVSGTDNVTATVLPEDASNKTYTWSSSDDSKATVSSEGLVTGVATGSGSIISTTEDGGHTGQCVFTIN